MTTKEKYSLTFIKTTLSNGEIVPSVKVMTEVNYNNVLTFITRFEAQETRWFIDDLGRWIQQQITEVSPYLSDTVEDMRIDYSYPNMIIDGWYTIPMFDLKYLLEEWLEFIS